MRMYASGQQFHEQKAAITAALRATAAHSHNDPFISKLADAIDAL
jgi:hypothetical protein